MNWGDVPAWVGAVIAAIAAFLAWNEKRQSKDAEDAAKKYRDTAEQHKTAALAAMKDAVAAEQRAASAADRSANALERQTQLAVEQAEAAAGVPWRVEHIHGLKWVLRNASDRSKFKVHIGGPGVSTNRVPDVVPKIDGQSGFEFWGTSSGWSGETVMRVDVTWHDSPDSEDEPRYWSDAMPPKG